MSTSNPHRRLPQPRQLRCGTCGPEPGLTIHAITAVGAGDDLLTVSYTCNGCGLFQEHPAYASDVAAVLHQMHFTAHVILFGDDYVHCGYPMEQAGFEIERLSYRTTRPGSTLTAVWLPTRVLRCQCGFQLEVPA